MSQYLLFQLIFFAFPLSIVLFVTRGRIFRYTRTLFWTFFAVYTVGFFWDWLSVRTGVWTYEVGDTLGVWLWRLPIEEFLGFYTVGILLIVAVIDAFCFRGRGAHVR